MWHQHHLAFPTLSSWILWNTKFFTKRYILIWHSLNLQCNYSQMWHHHYLAFPTLSPILFFPNINIWCWYLHIFSPSNLIQFCKDLMHWHFDFEKKPVPLCAQCYKIIFCRNLDFHKIKKYIKSFFWCLNLHKTMNLLKKYTFTVLNCMTL